MTNKFHNKKTIDGLRELASKKHQVSGWILIKQLVPVVQRVDNSIQWINLSPAHDLNSNQCAVPEKIHSRPMEGHQKFLGGSSSLKPKLLEARYEAKLEFPGGREEAKQKSSMGEY